jgi:CBS domain containing-hemolysin-like protein
LIASGYEIVALIFCFILSALYSGSEAALMSIGIDRAKQLIEEGGRKADALSFMTKKPNELLTTILVGNNLVNVFAASLVTTIAARYFSSNSIGIATGFTTMLILIFGEIIPKSFARARAESLSVPMIYFLRGNYYLLYPVIHAFTWLIRKVLGKNAHLRGRIVTKDDIEYLVSKAEKEKTMDSKQLEMLNSILEFPTIKVKDIMIPRQRVNFIQANSSFAELISLLRIAQHSRYPVCDNDLDHTIGFLHAKDLAFVKASERERFKIEGYLKPPFFVYEHMKIQSVFDHMNRKKVHLALVKDENGLVVGIITLEDIIEEIMGEIEDEHDVEEGHLTDEDNFNLKDGILLEGSISLRDLYNDFDIKIPLNDNFSTLAGFLLDMLGNSFPEEGQKIVWEGLSFDLKTVENHEIKEVFIQDVDGEKHLFAKTEAHS